MANHLAVKSLSFLKKCGIEIPKGDWELRLTSHPYFPSLLALTDTLDDFGVSNQAILVERKKIDEMPLPFLAHVGMDFKIVDHSLLDKEKNIIGRDEFLNSWDGVAVFIESPTLNRGSKTAKTFIKLLKSKTVYLCIGIIGLLVLFSSHFAFNIVGVINVVFGILCLLTGYLLLQTDLGIESSFSRKFCSVKKKECDKILNSQGNTLFGIKLIDAATTFFLGYSLSLLFTAFLKLDNPIHYILPITTLPICFYSIIYQAKSRAWCRVCITCVAMLLLLNLYAFVALKMGVLDLQSTKVTDILSVIFFFFGALGLMPVIKTIFVAIDSYKRYKMSNLKWRRNPRLFFNLLFDQTRIDDSLWDEDVIIGNHNAAIRIILLANPFCDPCKEAYKKLIKLYKKNTDSISIIVRFYITDYKDGLNEKNIVVSEILHNYLLAKKSLGDIEAYKSFEKEWLNIIDIRNQSASNLQMVSPELSEILEKHQYWANSTQVFLTPAVFINGYELPHEYDIEDISEVLMELKEFEISNKSLHKNLFLQESGISSGH